MINEPSNEGGSPEPEVQWNTGEPIFPGMPAGEASRFMASFVSAFRQLTSAEKQGGRQELMERLIGLLTVHKIAAYEQMPEGTTVEQADRHTELALASHGLASIFAVSAMNPRDLLELSFTAIRVASEIMGKIPQGEACGNIRFVTRRAKDGMVEVASYVESKEETQKQMDASGINEFMAKLIKSQEGKEDKPENKE